MNDRNIVFETHNQVEATILQSILEANDIEVFSYKESLSQLYGFFSPSIGKISLGVHAEQMEKAKEVIAGYMAEPGPGSHDEEAQ